MGVATGDIYQGVVGSYNQGAFAIGTCLVGLIAYFIREWRMLHFVTSLIIIPQFFVYWWVIPESPRWLISKQKWRSVRKVLGAGLKINQTHNYQLKVIISDGHCYGTARYPFWYGRSEAF